MSALARHACPAVAPGSASAARAANRLEISPESKGVTAGTTYDSITKPRAFASLRLKMAGRHAKTLTKQQLAAALRRAAHSRYPERDRVMVLLSVKAGLRAGEIAKLTWSTPGGVSRGT
jgi:integrase